jgi:leucyl/phenylalanyl-tRNA--protein transferase
MRRYCDPGLDTFPSLDQASDDGLLAMGGDLSPARLQCAYSQGIFPWFEEGQPILWWSPDPRCVLYPDQFKTSRSLKKSINKASFTYSVDRNFAAVVAACAAPLASQNGTWITAEMHKAYSQLHSMGCAHSLEVWQNNELVGGLYGVALGRIFYGESMFSRVSDASKFALKSLCEFLSDKGYQLIDCQLESAHLLSLGAQVIPRSEFIEQMKKALRCEEMPEKWSLANPGTEMVA